MVFLKYRYIAPRCLNRGCPVQILPDLETIVIDHVDINVHEGERKFVSSYDSYARSPEYCKLSILFITWAKDVQFPILRKDCYTGKLPTLEGSLSALPLTSTNTI